MKLGRRLLWSIAFQLPAAHLGGCYTGVATHTRNALQILWKVAFVDTRYCENYSILDNNKFKSYRKNPFVPQKKKKKPGPPAPGPRCLVQKKRHHFLRNAC
jgi:hypothetical protein